MPKIHPNRLIFFLYSYHNITLHSKSIHEEVTFFVLQVSFEMNLNMHMSSTLIEYVHRQKHLHMYDKYIGPIFIQSSFCQWEMAMLLLDWPLTGKLPDWVVPARGITPVGIVFRVTEAHKPPHHGKVATT